MTKRLFAVAALGLMLLPGGRVQAQASAPKTLAPGATPSVLTAERTNETATLEYFNRDIATLRARVAGREPAERVAGAAHVLDGLVQDRKTGPIEVRAVGGGTLVGVAGRAVLLLTPEDVDELAGETLDAVSARAAAQMSLALSEADEIHAPRILLRALLVSLAAVAIGLALLWAVARLRRRVAARLMGLSERKMAAAGIAPLDALHSARVFEVEGYLTTALFTIVDLAIAYAVVGIVLRAFPYTRSWGESMRGFVIATVEKLGLQAVNALPGLFTVILILAATRVFVRLSGVWFHAVERGQVEARWLHPETVAPTRRLVAALLWVFAAIVAYPYMPGSQTDAFKGISVFLGLMLTLGSSGLVNQIMSGFMITYSRAIRVGDFVRVGDVEGTVAHVGVLSTKIRSPRNEDVTVPNAVVVAQTIMDYSRFGDSGVLTPTSVTIGYDAPWRQVHAMLLEAARRTAGLRGTPEPQVLQMGLEDFYVKYTLFVCLEEQERKPFVLADLHANIQDVFNEYGVQIMSPNYVLDPTERKVVPKDQWFAAPAAPVIGTVHSTNAAPSAVGGRPRE